MAAVASNALIKGVITAGFLIVNPLVFSFLGGISASAKKTFPVKEIPSIPSGLSVFTQDSFGNKEFNSQSGDVFITYESRKPAKEKNLDNQETDHQLPIAVEISADRQYWESTNIYVAEGNAIASVNNGTLKAGRISFNQEKNVIYAKENVVFERGSQYFRASYFKYDLTQQKGEIRGVYGIITVKLLASDLNLSSSSITKQDISNAKIELKDGIAVEGGQLDLSLNPFVIGKVPKTGINRWSFRTPKITINKKGWKAKRLTLSNDPFSPSQAKIYSTNVIAKDDKYGVPEIIASNSRLILENSINIPLGKRTFGGRDKKKDQRWILGLDNKDRDGFFLGRIYKPIKLNANYKLYLQPQFLIQRAINGKTNSYISPGSSVTSSNVSNPVSFSDLFGLSAKLKGKAFNKDSLLRANISTFNPSRIADGSRFYTRIRDQFNLSNIDDINATLFAAYRFKSWNGSLGRSDIYTSYGGFLDKQYNWNIGKSNHSSIFRTGLAKYQAEELNSESLLNLWRASIFNSYSISSPIYQSKNQAQKHKKPSPFSQSLINKGIIFNTDFTTKYYYYEDGSNQSSFEVSAGPEITFGNFQRWFLDYTKLSIKPGFTLKSGDSPFKFDNSVDLQKISFKLAQQIFGPIVLSGIYDVNIDSNSDQYGETINSKVAILWERRAYGVGLFYNIDDESGGLMFRLNGFDFDDTDYPSESFNLPNQEKQSLENL